MKLQWLILAAILPFLSCGKEEDFLFNLPFPVLNFTIPAGVNTLESHYFNIDSVPTNLINVALAQNFDPGAISAVRPREARLQSLFGNVDFDFVFEMTIQLCEVGDKTPNCGREIFWRQPVPENIGSFIDLIPNENDVKEMLEKDMVNIQVKLAQLRFTSPTFIEAQLSLDFSVL
ncbi:MAG: hypothetical protein KDC44_08945 [Phaeodactylibacter sp.]|nr:hypothetical protein [Phaeodactylibacter sp.]